MLLFGQLQVLMLHSGNVILCPMGSVFPQVSPCAPLILSTLLILLVFLSRLPSVAEQCMLCVIHAEAVDVQKTVHRQAGQLLHL